MKFIFFILVFSSYLFSLDFYINSKTTSNAKTLYIEFDKQKNIKYKNIIIDKRVYEIFSHPQNKTKMYALIPISYYQKPLELKAKIMYENNKISKKELLKITVKDGIYKKEKINVQPSKVNPHSKKVKKRTAKEYKQAMTIYNTFSKKLYIKKPFIIPMNSKITSNFGKARVYNDELKGYHSGTDFRAKIGTKIIASNAGKVVLAQNRFYSGNSIIIDHGHGIYTCYYHMSKFRVKVGDIVKKAQVIGLSGDTGRVTGPHLHFSARVGGLQVDPLQLIELINKHLVK